LRNGLKRERNVALEFKIAKRERRGKMDPRKKEQALHSKLRMFRTKVGQRSAVGERKVFKELEG